MKLFKLNEFWDVSWGFFCGCGDNEEMDYGAQVHHRPEGKLDMTAYEDPAEAFNVSYRNCHSTSLDKIDLGVCLICGEKIPPEIMEAIASD